MKNTVRKYSNSPYGVAVLHGGPGAPGYMAPVARELAKTIGVIEPIQTRDSADGQINELIEQLTVHADPPVTMIAGSRRSGALRGADINITQRLVRSFQLLTYS